MPGTQADVISGATVPNQHVGDMPGCCGGVVAEIDPADFVLQLGMTGEHWTTEGEDRSWRRHLLHLLAQPVERANALCRRHRQRHERRAAVPYLVDKPGPVDALAEEDDAQADPPPKHRQ